jgi:hypothetical protein
MEEMKAYLKSLGIRVMYFESGANWMNDVVKPPRNTQMTLDQILKGDELVALGIWPHAAYNAASCGVTLCSAYAGKTTCTKTCSIDLEIGGMEILGAQIDVIIPGNPKGESHVNLTNLSPEHATKLVTEGGILIRKGGAYILRPGDPVKLSLNALAREIEDSIGVYGRGDVNKSRVTELQLIYSAGIDTGLRDEMVTILKTWTDAIKLRGVSALQMKIIEKDDNDVKYIAVVTLDNMCMESAFTEDAIYVVFSSTIYPPKDAPIGAPKKHRYTLHCFDNTAIEANNTAIFKQKVITHAWIAEKIKKDELPMMLSSLMENKTKQLRLLEESVADPALFFACHQMIESVGIHTQEAHARCEEMKKTLIHKLDNLDNLSDEEKKAIHYAIKMGPHTPSEALEYFTSLRTLSETFDTSVEEFHKTMFGLHVAANHATFLDSYTAARQDVRNSGVTNIEQEIELYAVCMMVMEYVRTGYKAAIVHLIDIQTKALESVRKIYEDWLYENYSSKINARRALQVEPIDFIKTWTAKGNIREKTLNILQQIHQPGSMKMIDKRGEITNASKGTKDETVILGFAKVIENMGVKDIMKASTMCLYILHNMMEQRSLLGFETLDETKIVDANMTKEEKKEEANDLANNKKLSRFRGYHEQLQEQALTFNLRRVGVPFATFVKACLEDPNLYCKDCPKEKECVVCTATSCRVVGHSSSSNVTVNAVPMNNSNVSASAASSSNIVPPAPPSPRLKRKTTSNNVLNIPPPSRPRHALPSNASRGSAASNSDMNSNNNSNNKKGGTRKRARKTHKRHQRKRQTRNRKARKTRKN